jgi:hypothetical protein
MFRVDGVSILLHGLTKGNWRWAVAKRTGDREVAQPSFENGETQDEPVVVGAVRAIAS